jgi:TP901 family phage tail tape measure protein
MPTFKVSAKFTAKDRLSPVFDKMGKKADKFGDRASRSFKKASKAAGGFKNITKGILAAGAVQKGLGLIADGATAAAVGYLEFDNAITSASAKFKGLNLLTKEGQKTLQDLKNTAREVGATTEFSADQAAQGLDFLALAGFNAKQAMKLLPGVTNLATVANLDLGTATDIASDALGAFGMMTKDTEQLTKNFTRIQDVMAKTTATSNTNLEALFEGVKKGAPTFTSAGQSLESFSALMGVMANSGVKGEEAGTQLRNVMLRLAKPTKESAAVVERLGVQTKDSEGNFRDVVDILADFEKGLKGMGTQQRAAALSTVFGARAVTGVNILLQEGSERLRRYRKDLVESSGASQEMADIMRSSLMNRIKGLSSALMELGFKVIEPFSEDIGKLIDSFTKFVRDIDVKPFVNDLKAIGNFLKDAGVFDLVFATITNAFERLQDIFKTIRMLIKFISPALKKISEHSDKISKALDKFKIINELVNPQKVGEKLGKGVVDFFKDSTTKPETDIDYFKKTGLLGAAIAQVAPEFAAKRGAALRKREAKSPIEPQVAFQAGANNVDVTNNINSDNITVETQVKKTKGSNIKMMGPNRPVFQ